MSLEILYPVGGYIYKRKNPRGSVGDTLSLTSILDDRSLWAVREDGAHTNIGWSTLHAEYAIDQEASVASL